MRKPSRSRLLDSGLCLHSCENLSINTVIIERKYSLEESKTTNPGKSSERRTGCKKVVDGGILLVEVVAVHDVHAEVVGVLEERVGDSAVGLEELAEQV